MVTTVSRCVVPVPASGAPSSHAIERVELGGVNPTYRAGDRFLKAAPREHIAREEKAVAIARLMGLDRFIQPVWLARLPGDDDDRTYLAARWLDGRAPTDADDAAMWLRSLPDSDKTALLLHQYVIGDYDRHWGNWFRCSDGRIISLDWGCAFDWPVRLAEDSDESFLLHADWRSEEAMWAMPLSRHLLRHVARCAGRIVRIAAAGIGTRYARSLLVRLDVVRDLAEMEWMPTLGQLAQVADAYAEAEGLTRAPATTGMEHYASEMKAYGF